MLIHRSSTLALLLAVTLPGCSSAPSAPEPAGAPDDGRIVAGQIEGHEASEDPVGAGSADGSDPMTDVGSSGSGYHRVAPHDASGNGSVTTPPPGGAPTAGASGPTPAADAPANPPASGGDVSVAVALVTGVVTDVGLGLPSLGLGGKGTLAAAVKVRLSQLLDTGALRLLVDANVDVSGKFSVSLPLGLDVVVAQVLDASGHVIGQTLVGATGSVSGNAVVAAPVTTETSLEVQVLLGAAACGCEPGRHALLSLALDVSALIDVNLASAVVAAAQAGVDVDVLVDALVQATVAAHRARVGVLLDAGVDLDADACIAADVKALANLNVGLVAVLTGQKTLVDVAAQLAVDLKAALAASGNVSLGVDVRAQVAASLAFSTTLSVCLAVVTHVDAVVFASIHAAAELEARLVSNAVIDILKASGGTAAQLDLALAARVRLIADVHAAVSLDALVKARADFVAALTGQTSGGGLLGGLLGSVTGSVQALLGSLLGTVGQLSAGLDADLHAALGTLVTANVCVDLEASAKLDVSVHALVALLAKFSTDVQALGSGGGASAGASASALANVLACAELLVRVGH